MQRARVDIATLADSQGRAAFALAKFGVDLTLAESVNPSCRGGRLYEPIMKLLEVLQEELYSFGFNRVHFDNFSYNDFSLILKRQTWNTNRAICLLHRKSVPNNFDSYIKEMRKLVAFKVKFFPVLYGVGIQMVLVCPGIVESIDNPKDYVSKIDNQWAIVQSLYIIDNETRTFKEGRTWGQVITGKYQDMISETIASFCKRVDS